MKTSKSWPVRANRSSAIFAVNYDSSRNIVAVEFSAANFIDLDEKCIRIDSRIPRHVPTFEQTFLHSL